MTAAGFWSLQAISGDCGSSGTDLVRHVYYNLEKSGCVQIPFLGSLSSVDWDSPSEREAPDPYPRDEVMADGFLPERSMIHVHIDLFDVPLVPF
ncbi:hypothetical protein BAE44_0011505 [Dichanthelium oligosanthes]|uniref:Uncharacterized protein n=1 Tax=Dichanthelium oligosanthes TaxID=888268 RepID=A0A1E5VQR9_9POAL|nr:hypothetical protein BAE44_0011505 [Dichanthelium oligosanthes]